jgi:DNA invertase Pin-like site-specific DNA recombinase
MYIESVAAYIRVSTTEQKLHGISLDAQRQKLKEYAEKHNLRIVEWYEDDGVSARKLIKKRPALQRMINDARAGKFTRIIFIKIDRFFRSIAEYHECMKLIEPVIWTATEEKYDLSSANGRAFVNMKLTIAELEADQGGERVRLVNEYKVKTGAPLYGTRCLPFCYRVAGEKNKYIEKHPEYTDITMDLIEHVELNKSVRGAMTYINNKYDLDFAYGRYMTVLQNEMICGSYKGNPNYCEPYITRERFEALQKIIKKNPRTTENRTYIFSGLIVCPECGNRLAGAVHITRKNGKRYNYLRYRCGKHRRSKSCGYVTTVGESVLEQKMLENIEQIIADKKIVNAEIVANNQKVSKYDTKKLQEELDRLNYAWQKGRIKNVEDYDKQYDELIAKIEKATQESVQIAEEPNHDKIKSILSAGWKEIYQALDPEHKRAFWRSFIEEIHLEWVGTDKQIKDIKFF